MCSPCLRLYITVTVAINTQPSWWDAILDLTHRSTTQVCYCQTTAMPPCVISTITSRHMIQNPRCLRFAACKFLLQQFHAQKFTFGRPRLTWSKLAVEKQKLLVRQVHLLSRNVKLLLIPTRYQRCSREYFIRLPIKAELVLKQTCQVSRISRESHAFSLTSRFSAAFYFIPVTH